MTELERLKIENKQLKEKLRIAEIWVQRIIKEEVKKISKRKINNMTSCTKDTFMQENIEEIITKKIHDFFGDFILMNTPTSAINNIISGEINYYNFRKNPSFDGFSVISSYHKSIDVIIESFITKGFRKFAKKQKQTFLRENDPLEKTLNSVVNKGYILSVGRLYHLLDNIAEEKNLFDYGKTFKQYLDKYVYLKDIFLEKQFLELFKKIMDSEILGKKRHTGTINFVETRKARELLIGDFKNKNCLIYKLLETQEINY